MYELLNTSLHVGKNIRAALSLLNGNVGREVLAFHVLPTMPLRRYIGLKYLSRRFD